MSSRPQVKPRQSTGPWEVEGVAAVTYAANQFLGMRVEDPLELVKDDKGWVIRLKEGAKLPGAGDGNEGSGNSFLNDAQTYTATCPSGTTGPGNTVTVAAGTVGSPSSQDDANFFALQLATERATNGLACVVSTSIDDGIDGMLINSAGQIVIYGAFTQVNGYARTYIAVLDSNFELQPQSWKIPPSGSPNSPIRHMCLDGADNIYIVGTTLHNAETQYWQKLAQLSPDGGVVNGFISPTFAPPTITGNFPNTFASGFPDRCAYDSANDMVFLVGTFTSYGNTTFTSAITPINTTTGAIKPGFTWGGPTSPTVQDIVPDGAGNYFVTGGSRLMAANGSIFGFWSPSGWAGSKVYNVVIAGGWVYLAGAVSQTNSASVLSHGVVRTDATGLRDTTFYGYTHKAFNTGSDVWCMALQGTQLLVGGDFSQYNSTTCTTNLIRLNSDGSPDALWTCQTNGKVTGIIVEDSGTIIVCGYFTQIGPAAGMSSRSRIARITSTGVVI